ncbi:hypothetical protein SGA02_26620 [Staphylococcus gallinarum]|uniref:Uncharacterized protein n=1 Tax=Staphylococcus gallinarum TaxID=1293 RepID=A0ABQ0Y600_STAGA|nr:hypothetical protein SGA02_26620 [Staphylococcus gallinarum]
MSRPRLATLGKQAITSPSKIFDGLNARYLCSRGLINIYLVYIYKVNLLFLFFYSS